MASRFDPSAFIAAEAARLPSDAVDAVEIASTAIDAFAVPSEAADFRQFQANRRADCRTIEAVEAPAADERPWSAGLRDLQRLPQPMWMKADRWDRLIYVSTRLDRRWGQQAADLGWSSADLYGCHSDPSCAGMWLDGLAMSIFGLRTPVKVIDLTATDAVLQPAIEPSPGIPVPPSGAPMRFRRRTWPQPGQSLIWHAFAREGGP